MREPDLEANIHGSSENDSKPSQDALPAGRDDVVAASTQTNNKPQSSGSPLHASGATQSDHRQPERSSPVEFQTVYEPMMLSTQQKWIQQDTREEVAPAARSYYTPVQTVDVQQIEPKRLATAQLWNQQDTRQEDAPPPRSVKQNQAPDRTSDSHEQTPATQTGSEPETQAQVACSLPTQQLWNLQDTREEVAPPARSNKPSAGSHSEPVSRRNPTGKARPDGHQAHSPPRKISPTNLNETGAPAEQRDETDPHPEAESDDDNDRYEENGRPKFGPKRNKDKYDVWGRELKFRDSKAPRRQSYTAPKTNYGLGQAPLPEYTYADRHGRTELQVFQALVGIYFLDNAGAPINPKKKQEQPASVMSDIFLPSRAAASRHRNRGLYDRCISMDMKMRVMYSFSHYMISILYLLQILIAATLTAISAYTNLASTAITTLGAVNTVLAGILAWLNGQGMPIRYRRARDQFREVVKAIEATERLFATIDYMDWPEGTRPTPLGERDRLEKLYDQARQDQEANYPDTHEGPDKNAQANEAKKMEAKMEKHKKAKKEKAAELKKLEEQKRELETKLAGESEKQINSQNRERELEEREEAWRSAHKEIGEMKQRLQQQYENMLSAVKDICEEKGLDGADLSRRMLQKQFAG